MDPNESGLSSYYHQHHQHQPIPPPLSVAPPISGGGGINASPTNGVVPNININTHASNPTAIASTTSSSPMAYSNTVPTPVSTGMEGVKKKRGRPRKYATAEEAAAAKRLASANNPIVAQSKKKQQVYGGGFGAGIMSTSSSSRKFQLDAHSTAGDKFKPHVITVAAGEDVNQKIMSFMQQHKGEMCILSASGTVSNAFLKQPATSGGSITYEGRYDILSLCGSYVRTEAGKSGGLSVCLASNDGHIIGGGVGGPLTAAGPVQVIAGTFMVDYNKKDNNNTIGETSAGHGQSPSLVGGGPSMSGLSFRSPNDSYPNYGGGGGGHYMSMQ